MAIIDILTHYDAKKKAAHAAKTVKHGVSRPPLQQCTVKDFRGWTIKGLSNKDAYIPLALYI